MAFGFALLSPPLPTPLHSRPSLTLYFLLTGAFLLTLVPHVALLPVWITVSVILAIVVRSFLEIRRLPLPSSLFCIIVAVCLIAGICIQYRTIFGREPGTALMAGLLAIKFYEVRGPRDIAVILFSSFFVVMSALLYSQALELFIYCLIMMWVVTSLVLRLQIGDLPEDRLLRMLGRSGVIILQALPLAIFLFFFFPRYTGKLQMSLHDSPLGVTDTVRPGSIAQMSRDDTPAMYVKFLNAEPPTVETMYWRALVLWHYQNGTWTPGQMADVTDKKQPVAATGSGLVQQEITIWPHFQKWLFALDAPISPAVNPAELDTWAATFHGNVLKLAIGKLDHKARYTVTSADIRIEEEPSGVERAAATQLPGDNPKDDPNDRIDPRVRALADGFRREYPNDQAYVAAVLSYFRHNFVYTASPGTLKGDWLPIFLFQTKSGFCEHFASAFAVLMRLEKIPARLVVGYQGAEHNPYGDLYTVRQSNAHAWDEVWIEARMRWVRVDPTSILPPSLDGPVASASSGQNDATDDFSSQVAHHQASLTETYLPGWMHRSLEEMQLRREQIEADWDNLIFSYDPETQSRWAQAMGFGRDARVKLGLACLFAIAVCGAIFRLLMKRRQVLSPVESLYAAFCRNMAQSGVPRAAWEGPLAYTGRVAEAFPEKKEAIRSVGWIVAHARYGPVPAAPTAPKDLQSLLTLITTPQAAASSPHGQG